MVETTDNGGLPRLFRLDEVAEQTGLSLKGLRRDCRNGQITHVCRNGRRYMTREQVTALIEAHTIAAAQPADPDAEDRARVARLVARR